MKKFIYSVPILIALIILHVFILKTSEEFASHYAPPYQEISEEQVVQKTIRDLERKYGSEIDDYRPSKDSIALSQWSDYRQYISEHVSPIQNRIDFAANIFFFIAYMLLAVFMGSVLYQWIRTKGGRLIYSALMSACNSSDGLLSKFGLKKLFLNHQLNIAEKEFLQVKNLFESGLITEEDFLKKKMEIKRKIRNENLLNNN